jgi:hypothetical protein
MAKSDAGYSHKQRRKRDYKRGALPALLFFLSSTKFAMSLPFGGERENEIHTQIESGSVRRESERESRKEGRNPMGNAILSFCLITRDFALLVVVNPSLGRRTVNKVKVSEGKL